jgi:hypothetical protein
VKSCSTCKTLKPLSDFHKSSSRADGAQGKCKECNIACAKRHQRSLTGERKREYWNRSGIAVKKLRGEVSDYKASKGCEYCGETDPCCLDFHHTNTKDKVNNIANLVTAKSRKLLWAEIEKCMVLCSNCHRKLHAGRKLGISPAT